VLSNSRPPRDAAASGTGSGTAPAGADNRPGRRLIAVLLLAAAALDLTRCSLAMVAGRYPGSAAGLVAAGLAAAALTVRTARGYQAGQRWAGWAALLIGAASAPQAAASGFHAPYTIPDTATAALGVLLTVAVLATVGRTGPSGNDTETPASPHAGTVRLVSVAYLPPGFQHLGEKVQGFDVLGSDDGEVAPVQGGHVGQRQPFCDGDDRGVDGAQRQVSIGAHELGHARHAGCGEGGRGRTRLPRSLRGRQPRCRGVPPPASTPRR
jgi:hypothetical protein